MTPADDDPPSDPDPAGDDEGAPEHPAEGTQDPDEEGPSREEEEDTSPPLTPAELSAFLGRRDVLAAARRIIASKMKGQDVEDLLNDTVVEVTKASTGPRRDTAHAWFYRACRNAVARHHIKRERRRKYEGDMPSARRDRSDQDDDEAPTHAADAVADPDPRHDPTAETPERESWLVRKFLREQTKDDPIDRLTLQMMEEWAESEDEDETYESVARRHEVSGSAFKKRAQRLKEKYMPGYRKWRGQWAVWLSVKITVALVVAALGLWWALRERAPRVTPMPPGWELLAPSASARAPGPDIAEPTGPRIDAGAVDEDSGLPPEPLVSPHKVAP